jgi:hypothetical protein
MRNFINETKSSSSTISLKTGPIHPPATKDGRRWVVDEDAIFIGCVGKPKVSQNLPEAAKNFVEKVVNGRTS